MEGITCVVTGASQGIGKCTALGLARRGARVLMVSRDAQRAETTRAEIVAESGNPAVESLLADLSSQASVRELAERIAADPQPPTVLINNAAVASPERHTTEDGLERQLAVNHLAPFLLTNLLLDTLRAGPPARIINVASWIHAKGSIDFDDLQGEAHYDGPRAYNQSKLANVLFTFELARRLDPAQVTANCLHPGNAPTGLNNYFRPPAGAGPAAPARPGLATRAKRLIHRARLRLGGRPTGPPSAEAASRTSLHLASAEELSGVTGTYFVDARPADASLAAQDAQLARRLWDVSERLTGLA